MSPSDPIVPEENIMKTLFLYGKPENYTNYINAVEQLGARVLATADEYRATECDGLLLPGGGDVRSTLYGQQCNGSNPPNDERDNAEFRIIARFLALDRPILGICRGLQILNVVFGGTLIQHIPGHSQIDSKDHVHLARSDDPVLVKLYGEQFPVNSAHHQVVDQLGVGLKATLWSEDGYIEGLRHESRPIWATQWHPERTCFAHARPDTVDGSRYINEFLKLL